MSLLPVQQTRITESKPTAGLKELLNTISPAELGVETLGELTVLAQSPGTSLKLKDRKYRRSVRFFFLLHCQQFI